MLNRLPATIGNGVVADNKAIADVHEIIAIKKQEIQSLINDVMLTIRSSDSISEASLEQKNQHRLGHPFTSMDAVSSWLSVELFTGGVCSSASSVFKFFLAGGVCVVDSSGSGSKSFGFQSSANGALINVVDSIFSDNACATLNTTKTISSGLPLASCPTSTDGVIVQYNTFSGSSVPTPPYNGLQQTFVHNAK